ncbi:hypothetical protein CLU79DRAFT_830855 [Phycomyces nitens]|nr:hypothetical protein CLU79DRAFT_830855 [Phycomyces nitens]
MQCIDGQKTCGHGLGKLLLLKELNEYLVDDKLIITININIEKVFIKSSDEPRKYPKKPPLRITNAQFKDFHDITVHIFKNEKDTSPNPKDDFKRQSGSILSKDKVKEAVDEINIDKGETIHAHKVILAAASPWFMDLFLNGMKETTQTEVTIHGVDPTIFQFILYFSYGEDVYIKDSAHAIGIIAVANRLQFHGVKEYAFSCLQSTISKSTIFDIWEASELYDRYKTKSECKDYMKKNCSSIFSCPERLTASDYCAIQAIKIDGLKAVISESIFYNAVLARRSAAIREVLGLREARIKEAEKERTRVADERSTLSNKNDSEISQDTKQDTNKDNKEEIEKEAKKNNEKNNGEGAKTDDERDTKEDKNKDIKEVKETPNDGGKESLSKSNHDDNETMNENDQVAENEENKNEENKNEDDKSEEDEKIAADITAAFEAMELEFLADIVEKDEVVMRTPGMKDAMIEAYRHKAFFGTRKVSEKNQCRSILST